MFAYLPPADVDDLAGKPGREAFLAAWHKFIAETFQGEIAALQSVEAAPSFFSEIDGQVAGNPLPVTWNGFPLSISRLRRNNPIAAWKDAEVLRSIDFGGTVVPARRQDEYCEWFVYRTGTRIDRIVFTAEAPEYWVKLAAHDIDTVVKLYQTWVSPQVKKPELLLTHDLQWFGGKILKAGTYNPYNAWNTTQGVMHLTHPANTLGAEIDLAARATLLRADGTGQRITDVRRLACCADFGDPNRISDPNIGHGVNMTCLPSGGTAIQDVTLANPVALYMDALRSGVLTGPNDELLDDWFTFVRGTAGHGLMAVLAPPASAKFGFDKVKVQGTDLAWGGQIAELIQMVIYAKTRPHKGAAVHLHRCSNRCCMPKGTKPADVRFVNFDHDAALVPCADGFEPAYPPAVGMAGAAIPQSVAGLDPDVVAVSATLGTSKRSASVIGGR